MMDLSQNLVQLVQEQQMEISLLKTELNFHKERIDKQDQIIKQLTTKVDDLSHKLTSREEEDKDTGNIWKDTENLSIADAVKETAEKALLSNLGFVLDPGTGLYCNYQTGYYYDKVQELFYNGHTGTYYTYDADHKGFAFHSQIKMTLDEPRDGKKVKKKDRKDKKRKNPESKKGLVDDKKRVENNEEDMDVEAMEEGELSCSDSIEDECGSQSDESEEKEYPPCIRAIIQESSSPLVKRGSLFIITIEGGTIGSEGSDHVIVLPDDPNVEKTHARISYSLLEGEGGDGDSGDTGSKSRKYYIADQGTASGSYLNGIKLEPFHPREIVHGSVIKIGSYSLLVHIHPGSFTCGHCEPGLLQYEDSSPNPNMVHNNMDKPVSRNAMLRQVKKKFGIQNTLNQNHLPDAPSYIDRARKRRLVKGSDNPYEKTQIASTEESISQSNKGFKMLAKMGWSEGKTLGSSGDKGLLEPIKMEQRPERAGLGVSSSGSNMNITIQNGSAPGSKKTDKLKVSAITMQRFKEADQYHKPDDDDDETLS